MKRRIVLPFIIAVAAFLTIGTLPASAATLTWERGEVQHIEMDSAIAATVDHVELIGEGKTLPFIARALTNGRMGYDAVLLSNLALGNYAIRVVYADQHSEDFANVRVVEYQSAAYNPISDFTTISLLSFTFFALLLLSEGNDSYKDDQTTAESIDGDGFGRRVRVKGGVVRGLLSSVALDHFRSRKTIESSRISPIFSRLIADGGYLQYSLGNLVLLFPLLGAVGGVLAYNDIRGVGHITTPSLTISLFMIVLGALDAGATFIGGIFFGLLAATSKLFTNIYDIRTYIGLLILWIAPSILANKVRPLRKSFQDSDWWDRLTDVSVGSLTIGWTVRSLILGLNGCAHLKLPLSANATTCGFVAGAAIAVRYIWEEYVNHRSHLYLSYLSPSNVNEQDSNWRLAGWFGKSLLFLFFAVSFLGLSWEIWVALAAYLFPTFIKLWNSRFPNFPWLYQALPVGILSLILMTFVNKGYSHFVDAHLAPSLKSREIFLVMALPGIFFTIVRSFGRSPRPGDLRWYMRPALKVLYRLCGPIALALAASLTVGWIG